MRGIGRTGRWLASAAGVAALALGVCALAGCKPRIDSSDAKERIRAVNEVVTDQAVLANVAVGDVDVKVREAAVKNIKDQDLLAKVARETNDSELREAAFDRITDQSVLSKIAVEDKNQWVRFAAVRRLTVQTVLEKIAVEDNNWQARAAAVKKLQDQSLLAKIASKDTMDDGDVIVSSYAFDNITDTAVLAGVALQSENPDIRISAYQKFKDRVSLSKFNATLENVDTQKNVLLLRKISDACENLPSGQRTRLEEQVLLLAHILCKREIIPDVGDIAMIETGWKGKSEFYGTDRHSFAKEGESFTISFKVSNKDTVYSKTWETKFPHEAYGRRLLAADININDLLKDLSATLSLSMQSWISEECKKTNEAQHKFARMHFFDTFDKKHTWGEPVEFSQITELKKSSDEPTDRTVPSSIPTTTDHMDVEVVDVINTPDGYMAIGDYILPDDRSKRNMSALVHSPEDTLPANVAAKFPGAKTWGDALAQQTANHKPPLPAAESGETQTLPAPPPKISDMGSQQEQ